MKNIGRSLCVAFSMYSKIPVPQVEWTRESMKYCICFFPAVGAVIGAVTLIWNYLAGSILSGSPLFTAVLILIPVLISGGIHLDGLLDTADALSSYKSKDEKLEILKDSHAGAFAIIVGICWFVLDYGIYSEANTETLQVLAIGFILSRALSGFGMVTFRMAKNTGLAVTFSDMAVKGRVRLVMAGYILLCAAGMLSVSLVYGVAALAAAGLVFVWYRRMAYQKFGGITGDLAGFFLQNCELAMAVCVITVKILLHSA
ncbi:MAG: adenosylcobinamide-GDP ribazoletransferase [Firmicutes bacterium]|nr:adenosylcobinamide-GDP ribazoletransferase [Bacillota bacterium]